MVSRDNDNRMNQDQPRSPSPELQAQIDGYVQAINVNPSIGPMLLSHWRRWKKGHIVARGSLEDRMWNAYCEGVNRGITVGVTAILLTQMEVGKQEAATAVEAESGSTAPEFQVPEPTGEQCTANAKVGEVDGRPLYALWYPQRGGYVGKAVVVRDNSAPNFCVDLYVWHDGMFPFSDEGTPELSPVHLHLCNPDQFVQFGQKIEELLGDKKAPSMSDGARPIIHKTGDDGPLIPLFEGGQ